MPNRRAIDCRPRHSSWWQPFVATATGLALFLLLSASAQAECSFVDEFNGTGIDRSRWQFPEGDGSFLGRTQIRPEYPTVSDGCIWLRLDSYNPSAQVPGDSFFGSGVFTNEEFSVGGGCRAEVSARLFPPTARGLVGGLFFYRYLLDTGLHDEIDVELVSNRADQTQTNVYANEPFGAGHPSWKTIPGLSITEFNTYRIDWYPNQIRWYINDILVREESSVVPQGNMAFYLNIWAPTEDWQEAYAASLQPTANADANETHWMCVDWLRLSPIDSLDPPTSFLPALHLLLGKGKHP